MARYMIDGILTPTAAQAQPEAPYVPDNINQSLQEWVVEQAAAGNLDGVTVEAEPQDVVVDASSGTPTYSGPTAEEIAAAIASSQTNQPTISVPTEGEGMSGPLDPMSYYAQMSGQYNPAFDGGSMPSSNLPVATYAGGPLVPLAGGAGAIILRAGPIASIASRVPGGSSLLGRIASIFGGVGAAFAKPWNMLPGWLRTFLTSLGVVEGSEIILGDDWSSFLGGNFLGMGGSAVHPGTVVKTWTAGTTSFVKLDDGRIGALKKDGTWKYWKPVRPIVLHPRGAGDLRTLLRADRVLDRQSKQIKKVLNRRAPTRTRARTPRITICGSCQSKPCSCR